MTLHFLHSDSHRGHAAERRKYKEDPSTHKTLDAVDQMGDVEIQEKSDAETTQLQIREHLCLVNVDERFHGLDLDEHLAFNTQIHAVRGINFDSIVYDWQYHFGFDMQSILSQFVNQTDLVGSLEQARPEGRVHFEPGAENSSRDVVDFKPSLFFLFFLCGRGQAIGERGIC